MAAPGAAAETDGRRREHAYHSLRIARVVAETSDARSFVLEVPPDLAPTFAYSPGQFCTFRALIDDEAHVRCYSMSSTPGVDDELRVTVKRVPGGVVSGWMVDALGAGDSIEVAPPTGFFQLTADEGDFVAFAAGSGITPIFSLIKAAIATTDRRVRLLYANRDAGSVIFGRELDALAATHPERVAIVHRHDDTDGFVGDADVAALLDGSIDPSAYVCGPTPFMDIVERALLDRGVPPERIHVERFTPASPALESETEPVADEGGPRVPTRVTIELDGRVDSTDHHPGTTILQTARQMGMAPPSSCEGGSCATCMARLVEGQVRMHVNNALTPEEVDEGWVLTCQSVPTTASVHVVYGYD